MKKGISVIIVNYNVKHFLRRCLESVYNSKPGDTVLEVLVVDNASIDGSQDMVKKHFPEVILIDNPENVGFAKANNQAIERSTGEYILILNPDTVIEEKTLEVCRTYMENHPSVGALGVKMIDGAGNFLPESKRALPTLWNSITKMSGLSSLFPRSKIFNGYALGHLDEDKRHEIDVLCGAFMFVRRSSIDKVGMFDERFFMYGEDIDWSKRIKEGGYEIHYIPDTTIIHYKGESTKKESLKYVKVFYLAMAQYVEKHYTGNRGKWMAALLKAGISLRAGLSVSKRILKSSIQPLIDFALSGLGIYGFSQFWEEYYHHNAHHFDDRLLWWSIVSISSVMIFLLWFLGYYKKPIWKKRLQGGFIGILTILATYSLLPETMRIGRVIVLSGWPVVMMVTWITKMLLPGRGENEKTKNILIVSKVSGGEEIKAQLKKSGVRAHVLGLVCPDPGDYDPELYLNNISHLKELSKVLKADEIIFNASDIPMGNMMRWMMRLGSGISYKISGDDSLSIIGSKSKNTQGELYDIHVDFHLHEGYYRHIKRVFDFSMGWVAIILSPLIVVFSFHNARKILLGALSTIIGTKTWIGYVGEQKDFENLPVLKPPVFSILKTEKEPSDIAKENYYYARDYTVWQDFEHWWKNIF